MSAIFGFSGTPRPDWLARMRESLAHRGRDFGSGEACLQVHVSGSLGYLESMEQCPSPRTSGIHDDGEMVIALAGRLWNTDGQAPTLADLLDRYRRQGTDFLDDCSGTFVLAIRRNEQWLLARDGAGARTIAYATHQGRLVFAVEPKAILAVPGFPRRLRPASVAQYLTFSFVPGERTMLKDVYELPAGCSVTFSPRDGVNIRRWFHPESPDGAHAADEPEQVDRWPREFRRLLHQAVAQRLNLSEPPTVFLSGGLDSSVVAAEVARQSTRPVHTFSLHFGKHYPHELEFARAVADRCRTRHHEIEIRPREFLPRLRRMIWHLDDPIGDPITMPNYQLAARVADFTRAGFNGEGGDPCFGGPKNIPMLMHHWYGGVQREANFREQRYLESYRRGFEEIHRLLSPELWREIDVGRDLDGVLRPFFAAPRPTNFLDKLCLINVRLKGAHLILPKVERMFGAHGIEPLSPLFDDRMVRFSFQLPARWKLRGGVEKLVLKHAYQDELPTEVLTRPKSGMRVPVHFWFQGELKRYARKIFSRRALRQAGLFNPDRVRQLLDYSIEEGPGRYGIRLWMLLTFEIWRRIVIEREPI